MPGGTTPSGPGPILNDPVPAPPGLAAGDVEAAGASAMDMLNGQVHIFIAAFLVTLLLTPLVRRLAVAGGAVDHPDSGRKMHRYPVASLGGLAVFL